MTTIKRGPILVVLAGIIVLLVVATPFLHMRLGLPDAVVYNPPTRPMRRGAYDLISEGSSWGERTALVVVYAPGGITPKQKEAFTTSTREQKAHLRLTSQQ